MPEDPFLEVERQYLPSVMAEIRKDVDERAKQNTDGVATYRDIFRAFEARLGHAGAQQAAVSFFWRDYGFVVIMAGMAFVFGALGLAPYLFGASPEKIGYKPEAFLEIAKLFAGVIVGGAAGAAVATRGRGRQ